MEDPTSKPTEIPKETLTKTPTETNCKKINRKNFFTCLFQSILSNWTFCISIISFIVILIGWGHFGVSPLNTFEEIAYNQEQEKQKRDNIQFHIDLGNSYLKVEQIDAAEVEYKKVLELDPLNQEARNDLFKCEEIFGPISNETGYDPEIIKIRLDELIKINSSDPYIYLFLGDLYRHTKQPSEALIYYQKAIDLDQSLAAAYFGMGRIYNDQYTDPDRRIKAANMYEKALAKSPWNQRYLNNIGDQYAKMGKFEKAIDKFQTLLKISNAYLTVKYNIAICYRLTGNLTSAVSYQEDLITSLEDRNVPNMKINREEPWIFNVNSKNIVVLQIPEKKYLVYYDTAMTYYLLKNESKAIQYLKKAKDLQIDRDREYDLKKVVDSNINHLQKSQPSFISRSEEFRKRFLV
jgi:tetratricopeptide (TPR) repeat protein